ncbi:hypothetical protein LTR56_010512 [Elasticomyces elasticus]|nr:hypothetical protein LTR56_010512 [Elasticomyces elasticus]KAK3657928.1 hypothetical protein LTR22_009155 [Elasticomyces elasticus]KAK4917615.1 hypothetical protein LTR49_014569 [Elasticomyces elasticus]KAK5762835.1 hypothetical protein LTS12_007024 [Elasticomyces elasticus]
MSTSPCGLLSLPPEIRMIIWTFAIHQGPATVGGTFANGTVFLALLQAIPICHHEIVDRSFANTKVKFYQPFHIQQLLKLAPARLLGSLSSVALNLKNMRANLIGPKDLLPLADLPSTTEISIIIRTATTETNPIRDIGKLLAQTVLDDERYRSRQLQYYAITIADRTVRRMEVKLNGHIRRAPKRTMLRAYKSEQARLLEDWDMMRSVNWQFESQLKRDKEIAASRVTRSGSMLPKLFQDGKSASDPSSGW